MAATTIVGQISRLEKETAAFKKQLEDIDNQLKSVTNEPDRRILYKIAETLKADMEEKESKLAHLRKENRKTTLAAILIFIILVLFYVFIMSPLKQNKKSEN
ncbi:PREDICTED: uncharacterized protein LOC109581161 isoform X1 [Amphimedon queenslandica]|uniref:Coiled-coil domain-containing protein 167 n=1 Tax=Amphimedon queenslandica TaxID=400682 RepID=A0A1X7V713_AMPQE|nr:PREDICTED: uncharacterized protein LOC109581161 isoform X1 [Amphimedon queenslandica]|eukprot:XP_019850567.1 PREDICTED: uncharacterized protein LOC109581161 isoform X1 [Amphimedon queenslandica]